jgi:hypothetical protein
MAAETLERTVPRTFFTLPLNEACGLRLRLRDRRFWAVQAMVIGVTVAPLPSKSSGDSRSRADPMYSCRRRCTSRSST